MECAVWLSLLEEATIVDQVPGIVAIETPSHLNRPRMTLVGVTDGLRAALQQLQGPGIASGALLAHALRTDGMPGLGKLHQYLMKLGQFALLCHQLRVDDVPIASIRPLSISYRYEEHTVDAQQSYVLSRFAYMRHEHGRMLLECPLGHAEMQCHAPAVLETVHALTAPRTVHDIAQQVRGLNEASAGTLMNFLANAQALVPSTEGQTAPEMADPTLAPWEFHDLLFHTRSRLGRHDRPYGGTFPFKDQFAPLPIIKPAMSHDVVPLYRPDLDHVQHADPAFTTVLEQRTSVREQGEEPLSVQQLGEFLYRTARVKRLAAEAGVSFRPSPSGGALYELEIYPLVDRCTGLPPGMYHYNPLEHQLAKVADPNPYVNTLLRIAGITATMDHPPQVLLILAARFQRMQLKYQSMTYAVILKNVGALYQTMYLVATAMGLAPCALGGGHSDIFAHAAGLHYLEETSVGEFILGSCRHADTL